jgi:unsaturated rhamnogalacturonyl hydrolase
MENKTQTTIIKEKLECLVNAFTPILYEDDEVFLAGMKDRNLAGDDIRRYQHWEWTQGVGLYGLWKLFDSTKEVRYLDILTKFFDSQIEIGFPALNVNTMAPFLTMSYVGEYLHDEKYLGPCRDAANWIMEKFPRTEENGLQHMTSDTLNDQELWDDTLFMTVLFLANMGRIEGKREYIDEAQYQFLLHAKYLADPETGLWYHGWTFNGRHNFAQAFWGRGNCWVTIAIPEFLQMVDVAADVRDKLIRILLQQVGSLVEYQNVNGMWHTLIDDSTSYVESSATCGFAYGILRSVHTGLIDECFAAAPQRALRPILDYIDESGVVHQVSYGTPMGRETKDFYKNIELKPMPYGQALAMLFLIECLHE